MDARDQPEVRPEAVSIEETDGLIGRLHVIESQPLAERAAHYGQLHDELAAALEQRDGR